MKKSIKALLVGVISLSFLTFGTAASANSVSIEPEVNDSNLTAIDTQGLNVELYVDKDQMENVSFFIDDQRYAIEDNKLVKSDKLEDSGHYSIMATDRWVTFLKNGQTISEDYIIDKGQHAVFASRGDTEHRVIKITDNVGKVLARMSGDYYGLIISMDAPHYGLYTFSITNKSATDGVWTQEVTF